MGQFVPWFDHIVLLSAPTGVLLERVRTRTGNPYGKSPAETAQILENIREIEPLLRQMATLELATDRPLNDVTEAILHLGQ